VTGLQVHQSMIDVVGNNLSNANTPGFKGQDVRFQDLVYQTLSPGSAPGTRGGGTNPEQVGFGAIVGAISVDFDQGALQDTGRNLGLANQGTGFFGPKNGVQNSFPRAGSFSLDQQGFVVDSATGNRVQRTGTVGEGSATSP